MKILITGSAGFIGRVLYTKLRQIGHDVIGLDMVSSDYTDVKVDIRRPREFSSLIKHIGPVDTCIHLAALIDPFESTVFPENYYDTNVNGTLNVIQACKALGCWNFIYASTGSVYSCRKEHGAMPPFHELSAPIAPMNPYSQTKYTCESILRRENQMHVTVFRFFNVAGSYAGLGDKKEKAFHLIPKLVSNDTVHIYGNDYDTNDGTCVRDYIHVADLCDGIMRSIDVMKSVQLHQRPFQICNLGSGTGYSVLEIVTKYFTMYGEKPVLMEQRREGDPAILVADNRFAKRWLNWEPKHTIEDIIKDTVEGK